MMLGYTDRPLYTDLSSDLSDRCPTLPTNDSDDDCRQWPSTIFDRRYVGRTDSYCFPTGQATEPKSPTHCRGWQPTSDFRKAPDQPTVSSGHHPAAEYRHIVGQSTQTPYDRYEQLSYQGHVVWPPWGIVLSRTWINPSDLTIQGDLTTPQLSAPLMTEPYRILL